MFVDGGGVEDACSFRIFPTVVSDVEVGVLERVTWLGFFGIWCGEVVVENCLWLLLMW